MSLDAAEPVSVQILGKEYLIACPPAEREDLQQAAALLGTRLKEVRESGKFIGTDRLLLMTALNMANDLAKLAARDEHRGAELGVRVKQMRERVERALVQGQQLEL
ncbi:MAG: cell division protein ZapA [Steroidobacteraceae bacterium]